MTALPANTIPRAAALRALDAAVSERQLMDSVTRSAEALGWEWHHQFTSIHSKPGWPDLTLVRPGRLIFVEVKSQRGAVRSEQWPWLTLLAEAGAETALWRPSDDRDGTIAAVLMGQRTDHRESQEYAEWLAKPKGRQWR